ncbi:MAG TPA: hypothetical protein VFD70_30870 [Anaerolineae bacterium]|nr:hypothetical protein [Anaerolineae bacterium]
MTKDNPQQRAAENIKELLKIKEAATKWADAYAAYMVAVAQSGKTEEEVGEKWHQYVEAQFTLYAAVKNQPPPR